MTLAALITAAMLQSELQCASLISYYEERSSHESYAAKVAPVIVARNRVLDDRWPDTFCGVMKQPYQFAFVTSGLHRVAPSNEEAWDTAKQAAYDVLNLPIMPEHLRPMQNSLYFHSGPRPNWDFNKLEETVVIGDHIFYTDAE